MSMITVSCPHCSFSRQVPADKLPDQTVQATCPHCKQVFSFTKPQTSIPPVLPPVADCVPPPLPESAPQTPSAAPPDSVSRPLLPVGKLFATTWELFKQRGLLLIGLFLATAVAAVIPPMLIGISMGGLARESFIATVVMIMLLGLALTGSMLILSWGMTATVAAAVDNTLGFRDAFQRAKGCWLSFIWVSSLYSFIVGGASLLFVIPGIMTSIWFFCCPYLVIAEDTRGMDALLKSKALVDGRFWEVLGRLALVWLLGMVLGMIPVIGVFFSLAMAAFSMLYSVSLYRDLRATAGHVTWSSSDGTRAGWLLLGLIGYLLMPLLLFFMLGAAFFTNFGPLLHRMIEQNQGHHQTLSIEPAGLNLPGGIIFPRKLPLGHEHKE